MKNITNTQKTLELNGGKTYYCPFGCNKSGSFASVYAHCIWNQCFTRNKALNGIWGAAKWCFSTALTNELCRVINVSFKAGKHAK